ncbi:hypothetical protein ACGFKX_15665 [Pseudonocardia alni]|uniref:hypothetical protein n=1 Tax=Pseudonocardia alni TaxID=33907 RepID=UPI003714E411
MIPPEDMDGLTPDGDMTSEAMWAALRDLDQSVTFNQTVRADVETTLLELMTAFESGAWSNVFPTSEKTLEERRYHVDVVREAAGLETHVWVNG